MQDEAEEEKCTITDLPILKVEGAPSGWNPGRSRRRGTIAATPSTSEDDIGDQLSALRGNSNGLQLPPGFNSTRRRSTMTFNEWVDLKKFQHAHEAKEAAKRENKPKNDRKLSITYEEWKNSVDVSYISI